MDNQIIEVPVEVELLDTTSERINLSAYTSAPISEISTYGIVGNELLQMFETIKSPGGEGIYRVTFPKGVRGALSHFKNENAFYGAVNNGHGYAAQARLTQIPLNPEHLFMAIALMDINSKLGEILKTQKKMLEFMYIKEESEIQGNYGILNEAIRNYQYNWDQDSFISSNRGLVRDIKRDMYSKIELYEKQISSILETPKGLHLIGDAGKKVQELTRHVYNYHNALYLITYATFFEALLMRNFNSDNLENIKNTIASHVTKYQSLYNKSYEWAKKYITSSVNYVAAPMLYRADKAFEYAFKKIPVGLDRFYGAESELYRPVQKQLKPLGHYQETGTDVFIEGIDKIDAFHNKALEMYLDKENVYFLENKEE